MKLDQDGIRSAPYPSPYVGDFVDFELKGASHENFDRLLKDAKADGFSPKSGPVDRIKITSESETLMIHCSGKVSRKEIEELKARLILHPETTNE